jgi:hypothetical protein
MVMVIILAVSVVVTVTVLAQFGIFGTAQGQGNLTIGNVTLTPEQRAAICDPSDTHVNTTESKICGIPKTPTNITTPAANTTTGTGTETSPSPTPPATSIAPEAVPPPFLP